MHFSYSTLSFHQIPCGIKEFMPFFSWTQNESQHRAECEVAVNVNIWFYRPVKLIYIFNPQNIFKLIPNRPMWGSCKRQYMILWFLSTMFANHHPLTDPQIHK